MDGQKCQSGNIAGAAGATVKLEILVFQGEVVQKQCENVFA